MSEATTAEHTPLPWTYFYSGSGGHDIVGADDNDVATCHSGWALSKDEHFEVAHADAKFIVEACNNHEKLLNSLKEIVEIYAGMDGFVAETAPEGYQQRIIKQMYEQARSALSSAEE